MFPRKIVEEPLLLDRLREEISAELATNQSRLEDDASPLLSRSVLLSGASAFPIRGSILRNCGPGRVYRPFTRSRPFERRRAGCRILLSWLEGRTGIEGRLGWPARTYPSDAIDDAERDLAVLDQITSGAVEQAGAARYLLTTNQHLARALRTRYQRWGRGTAADGLTSSQNIQAIMANHALQARSYSPTALELYARCPYRFFLQPITVSPHAWSRSR